MEIDVNARFLTQRTTGAQRYAFEVGSRLARYVGGVPTLLTPRRPLRRSLPCPTVEVGRFGGHLWEQTSLPLACHPDRLLFSPCNVGPLAVRHQVVTIHDVFSIERPEWVSPAFHRWYAFLLPRLARRVRHLVTVSEYSKGRIVETLQVSPEKVSVIPLGVDSRFRPPSSVEVERTRTLLKLPERFVLTLGSLEPRKNLSGVLDAWSRLPDSSRVPLVIAGGLGNAAVFGNFDVGQLEKDGVQRLGYVADELLPGLYGAASLFVYPSFEEGFGLPPVEALACGATVITSDTSAMGEFCRDFATLVDPHDAEALAEALRAQVDAPESPEVRRARARIVAERFTWDRTTEALANVLRAQVDR